MEREKERGLLDTPQFSSDDHATRPYEIRLNKLKLFKWFAFTASMLRVYAVNALVFNALSCVHPRPCKARGHGHVAQPHGRSRTLHHYAKLAIWNSGEVENILRDVRALAES